MIQLLIPILVAYSPMIVAFTLQWHRICWRDLPARLNRSGGDSCYDKIITFTTNRQLKTENYGNRRSIFISL